MDLARLRTLRELAARHTMAAVADALFLTPSAVSQQIAQLEQEIGIPLIEKQGRGVKLTPAGERLAAHADRLFTVLGEARADMAALREDITGTLRVAVFPTAGASLLPATIQRVGATHPYLEAVLEEMEPDEALAALRSGRCDLAFVDDLTVARNTAGRAIEKVALIDDTLYALLPARHRLAGRAALSVGELQHERWALDSAWNSFAEFVLGLCRQAGFEPQVNARCRGFEILAAMVAEGCSVSIVAGLRLMHAAPGLAAVKLRPGIRRRISVAYRSGEGGHPAIRAFLEALEGSVARHRDKMPQRTLPDARTAPGKRRAR